MTNVAVLGISGRVGRCLVRAIRESPDFALTGALASPSSATLGRDAGEVAQSGPVAVPVTADRAQALAKAEVAIDFTLPDALPENLAAVEKAGIPLVVGITGLDAARQGLLRGFSERQAGSRRAQHVARREPPVRTGGPCGGRLAAGLRRRDPRSPPPRQGRRAFRDRASARRDCRRRARRNACRARRVRPPRQDRRARARRDRLREPSGRGHRRPAPGPVRRHGRDARARCTGPRIA